MQLVDPSGRIAIQLIEAKGVLASMQGLLGATDLAPGYGLLLRAKEVHTMGMRFAIDTIYLDRHGAVLRVATMPPGKIGPVVLRARHILEMRAGEAERLGIRPGGSLVRA